MSTGEMVVVVDSLRLYTHHKVEPGGFLRAVLENDLRRACELADIANRYQLFDIVSYIYNELPANCWGSPERVRLWLGEE